jgi:hypothetical protein
VLMPVNGYKFKLFNILLSEKISVL